MKNEPKQLWQDVPELVGPWREWQEGDRNIYLDGRLVRQRPVPVQSGKLWRDLGADEKPQPRDRAPFHGGFHNDGPLEWQYWEPQTIYEDGILWQRPVPATCGCEGLRTALQNSTRQLKVVYQFGVHTKNLESVGEQIDQNNKALAQPGSCQQPISEKGGDEICAQKTSNSWTTKSKSQQQPSQFEIDSSEKEKSASSATPESDPPAVAIRDMSAEAEQRRKDFAELDAAAAREAQEWTIVESSGVTQVHTRYCWVGETTDTKVATIFKVLVNLHNSTVAALRRELERTPARIAEMAHYHHPDADGFCEFCEKERTGKEQP